MEGRIFGVAVSFDFAFFLAVVLFLLADTTGAAVLMLLAAAIHECCHLLAMALLRVPVTAICFTAFGLRITRRGLRLESYAREALISLAGGFGNLLTAFAFGRSALFPAQLLAAFSLVLGVLNLLPMAGLDGGRLLHEGLCCFFCQEKAGKALTVSTALLLVGLWILLVVMSLRQGINWMLALFCVYLTAAAARDLAPGTDWHLNRRGK